MSCPSDDIIARFDEGLLESHQADQVTAHLSSCASCRSLLAALVQQRASKGTSSASQRENIRDTLNRIPEGTLVGRYVTKRFLGAGSMSVVLEAWDPELKRSVAIKFLKGNTSEQVQAILKTEAQLIARVSHPNVIAIFDVGVVEKRNWIAMEFVEGFTLKNWVNRGQTKAQIIEVLKQAARGLSAAHQAGLVHRDFKPDNLLVQINGRAVVVDFGLSRISDVHDGASVGTPAYMAPETIQSGVSNESSDQYSFCVTAVEALCGERPTVNSLERLLQKLDAPLRQIMKRGLAQEPQKRFASMKQLELSLENAQSKTNTRLLAAAILTGVVTSAVIGFSMYRAAHLCDLGG